MVCSDWLADGLLTPWTRKIQTARPGIRLMPITHAAIVYSIRWGERPAAMYSDGMIWQTLGTGRVGTIIARAIIRLKSID